MTDEMEWSRQMKLSKHIIFLGLLLAAGGFAVVLWSGQVRAEADKKLLQEYQIAAAYNRQYAATQQMNAELENTLLKMDADHYGITVEKAKQRQNIK